MKRPLLALLGAFDGDAHARRMRRRQRTNGNSGTDQHGRTARHTDSASSDGDHDRGTDRGPDRNPDRGSRSHGNADGNPDRNRRSHGDADGGAG
jgi:hypothetical protein